MSEKQNNNEQINNFTIKKAIDNIKDKKRYDIYNSLWEDNKFFENINVQKVFWQKDKKTKKDRYSDNSYAFQIKDDNKKIIDNKKISTIKKRKKENKIYEEYLENIKKKLKYIFNIKNEDNFDEKVDELCSGSGSGSDLNALTTLHSSSLCALLFFHNVSGENSLTLTIDSKEITFKNVLFEFQNTVIEEKGRNPSSVDVVLLGEIKEEKKKVILFLESKFSEYLSNGSTNISKSYLDKDSCPIGYEIYNDEHKNSIFLSKLEIEFKKNEKGEKILNKDKEYTLQPKDEKYYIHGIKQIISHYIGINNLLNGKLCENNTEKLKKLYAFLLGNDNKNYNEEELKEMLNDDNTKIYLGEIMFDFRSMNKIDNREYFNNYSNKYKELAKILNSGSKVLNTKIKVLDSPLTYSLFKDNKIEHKIEDNIKKYYKLN